MAKKKFRRKTPAVILALGLVLASGLVLEGCSKCPSNGDCKAVYDSTTESWKEDGCGCLQGQQVATAKCTC
ncbi:MAG: hypothetical protein LBJ86_04785 [Spirochaetaceae bacterium]|jgi:hypothetical protein|nr:hypothetical protein [Spirochaetaceae bacterium]